MSGITMNDMDFLVADLAEAKIEADEAKRISSAKHQLYEDLKAKVLVELEASNLDSFKGTRGTVSRTCKFEVKFPRGSDEEKNAFREYLEAKGVFNDKWEMNYQSLNSWYKEEMAAAIDSGDIDFEIPGLKPDTRVTLSFRSK